MGRQNGQIWGPLPSIAIKGTQKGDRTKAESLTTSVANVRPLPSARPLRNALDFAGTGCLQLAQAVSCRLFGILIALPLILGFQAGPFIRVHRLDISSVERAVGSRLGRKQRRVGRANAQFDMLPRFGVDTGRQANRGCPDLPLNRIEPTVNRITRAPGEAHREDNDGDGRQSWTERQPAVRP